MNSQNNAGSFFAYNNFFEELDPFGKLFSEKEPVWETLSKKDNFLSTLSLDGDGNYIDPTSKIHPTAIIKNSYIGPNTKIFEFVNIRQSLIAPNNVIGHCTEVVRSVVLADCSIPRFNYIGSSIIGKNVRFGGVCSLASRRFDDLDVFIRYKNTVTSTHKFKFGSIIGDNCIIGYAVHCSPGTIVGKDCIIMPHLELRGIIANNSVVSSQQKLFITPKRDLRRLGLANITRGKKSIITRTNNG